MHFLTTLFLLISFGTSFSHAQGNENSVSPVVVKEFINQVSLRSPPPRTKDVDREKTPGLMEEKSFLSNGLHTEIVPEYTDKNEMRFNFHYDKTALENPRLLIADLMTFAAIQSGSFSMPQDHPFRGTVEIDVNDEIVKIHALAELISNARSGSPLAQARWLEIKSQIVYSLSVSPEYLQKLNLPASVSKDLAAELEAASWKKHTEAETFLRAQKKEIENWKKESRTLDKLEALPEKLNDLVLNNDRAGVRRLLEAYLPWAIMEPSEVTAWKTWLEAIEHPDRQNTVIAARGTDYETDKVQRKQTPQGEALAFFSTVLTKNQGNYTRRLRSLTTNREKNGDIENIQTKLKTVKISDQFLNHSINPKGSNFLSFTTSLETANDFVGREFFIDVGREKKSAGGLLVVQMDKRRMIPNILNSFHEREFLAPLIVFPDEVVLYVEGAVWDASEIKAEIHKRTGRHIENSIEHYYRDYITQGMDFLRNIGSPSKLQCSRIFQ